MSRAIERKFYDSDGNPTGTAQVLTESLANSGNMDIVNSSPPSSGSRTQAIFGWDTRQQYITEAIRTANPQQLTNMSQQLFFHPNFAFSVDFFGWMSVADRLKFGINCFSTWAITNPQRDEIPARSGVYYVTENSVSGPNQGYNFYKMTLSQWEAYIETSFEGVGQTFGTLKNFGRLVFNFEQSQFFGPGNVGVTLPGFTYVGGNCGAPGYPSWESIKDSDSIRCETDGVVRTLQECADKGQDFWLLEFWYTRRVNRMSIALLKAKAKSVEGAIITYGTAIKQGFPRSEAQNETGLFIDGNCNVSKVRATNSSGAETGVTGDGDGNILLNGRSFNIKGILYNYENADQGYWYKFTPSFETADYNDIFVNHTSGTQNYPYVWSKMKPEHFTAEEKGFWQENRRVMRARRTGGSVVGIMRQTEIIYEGNEARVPFPELQGVGGETAKLFQSPQWAFSSVVSWRFLCGNDDPGNGYHSFPITDPDKVVNAPSNTSWDKWNHHWHSYTAMIQGRMYLQRLERWFTGSTLIENPDIRIGATGTWVNYDGVAAWADGNPGSQKPCAAIRYKSAPGGIQVELMIGMNQTFNQSRTDEVRAPGGGAIGGNILRITYRGMWTRVVSVFIPTGTVNQLITLGDFGVPSWEPSGYAGRTQLS